MVSLYMVDKFSLKFRASPEVAIITLEKGKTARSREFVDL
jgi:hypothetical protein